MHDIAYISEVEKRKKKKKRVYLFVAHKIQLFLVGMEDEVGWRASVTAHKSISMKKGTLNSPLCENSKYTHRSQKNAHLYIIFSYVIK